MMGPMYAPKPKCNDTDYIDFLIASPRAFSCTEAAAVQPELPDAPAHDAFNRLLHRLEPDPATLWEEARPMVRTQGGLLVLDDSTLGKVHAKKIQLVARHWSGKHERVIERLHTALADRQKPIADGDVGPVW
jgi:putative transposase